MVFLFLECNYNFENTYFSKLPMELFIYIWHQKWRIEKKEIHEKLKVHIERCSWSYYKPTLFGVGGHLKDIYLPLKKLRISRNVKVDYIGDTNTIGYLSSITFFRFGDFSFDSWFYVMGNKPYQTFTKNLI